MRAIGGDVSSLTRVRTMAATRMSADLLREVASERELDRDALFLHSARPWTQTPTPATQFHQR